MKMFNKYKKNFFSQNGEDGVILELFKRLKLKKKIIYIQLMETYRIKIKS